MTISYTYMEAIGRAYPGVQCQCFGDPSVYENIVYQGGDPLPTIEELNTWIAAQIKEDMWLKIKDERDRRKTELGYKVGNYWYHSDTYSRTQQLGLVMIGANLPQNIMWKTMSGEFVLMTPTLAGQIFQAAIASDMTIHSIAEQKRQAMLVSADPGSFDWASGWPKGYGE